MGSEMCIRDSPEVHQKFSSSEELDSGKLFNSDEVKVEKLFDDEQLDRDLYQDEYQEPQQQLPSEGLVPDNAS